MVGGIAGHGSVAAGGAEEPFSVGSGLHEFEITILGTIGAADGAATIAANSSHFENESVAFFVDRKASIVDGGRIRGEWFRADCAAGKFCIHYYFPASPEAKRKSQCSAKALDLYVPWRTKGFVFFPVEAAK